MYYFLSTIAANHMVGHPTTSHDYTISLIPMLSSLAAVLHVKYIVVFIYHFLSDSDVYRRSTERIRYLHWSWTHTIDIEMKQKELT